jgi:thioredoxin 2
MCRRRARRDAARRDTTDSGGEVALVSTMNTTIVTCPRCGKKNRVASAAPGVPHCGNCGAPLPWIAQAHDDDFHEVAEKTSIPVVVDLWAPWCGPCKMVTPALERLAADFAGRVKLVKVNVDEAPATAQRFSVQGIPTLLVTDHGHVVASQTGAVPEPALRDWLAQSLDAIPSART